MMRNCAGCGHEGHVKRCGKHLVYRTPDATPDDIELCVCTLKTFHRVGVTTSRQTGKWLVYCIDCSEAAEDYVYPCSKDAFSEDIPPVMWDADMVVETRPWSNDILKEYKEGHERKLKEAKSSGSQTASEDSAGQTP